MEGEKTLVGICTFHTGTTTSSENNSLYFHISILSRGTLLFSSGNTKNLMIYSLPMREIFSAQGKKIQSLGIRVVLPENRSELNEMLPSLINDGVVTVDTNGNIKIIGSMIWEHGSLLDLFMY